MLVQDSEFYLLLFLLLFSLGSLLVSPVRGVLITPELQYVTDKVKLEGKYHITITLTS